MVLNVIWLFARPTRYQKGPSTCKDLECHLSPSVNQIASRVTCGHVHVTELDNNESTRILLLL